MKELTAQGLDQIVDHYIEQHRDRLRRELRYFEIQRTLQEAVEAAALSKTPGGKRHPHQRRIPGEVLQQAAKSLLADLPELRKCKSFEELIDVIDTKIRRIRGIGELAVYDIALRIGAHLGLYPHRVFVHAGTTKGLRALGLDYRRESIVLSELPEPFHRLQPHEAEDCLCIYKSELSQSIITSKTWRQP